MGSGPSPFTSPSYPPPPGPNYYGPAGQNNTLALASMILGIVGLVFMCLYGFGGLFSIAALVTGNMAKKQPLNAGDQSKVRAGLITGWIGVGLAVLVAISIIIAVVVGVSMNPPGGN